MNTIQMMYGYGVNINNTYFKYNDASSLSKNLFFGFSNVTITNCYFYDV